MSFFVARLEKEDAVADFAVKCRKPQKVDPKVELFRSTFLSSDFKLTVRKDCILWSHLFNIKMPPIYLLSIVFAGLAIIFLSVFWASLAFVFALTYVPFSKSLHVWAFKKGLRKTGYKGRISILSLERGMEEVLFR